MERLQKVAMGPVDQRCTIHFSVVTAQKDLVSHEQQMIHESSTTVMSGFDNLKH